MKYNGNSGKNADTLGNSLTVSYKVKDILIGVLLRETSTHIRNFICVTF